MFLLRRIFGILVLRRRCYVEPGRIGSTGVLIVSDRKLGLEFGGVRASDRGAGGVAPGTRARARGQRAARGATRGVGAGDGVLGGFLAGLFLRYSRVNRIAEALGSQQLPDRQARGRVPET